MSDLDNQAIKTKGHQAAALVAQPGYKDLLDDLEKKANVSLSELKAARYADPVIIKGLLSKWLLWEDALLEIQRGPYGRIRDAENVNAAERATNSEEK
jgi:hypothetical protein